MNFPNYLIVFISILSFGFIQAQEDKMTAAQALKQENIEKQFDYVILKSGKFQDYKVVKRFWLDKLKANTIDSINTLESKLTASNQNIEKQKKTIKELQESLTTTNENLTSVTQEKDNMSFMGMDMTKSSYKTTMWAIVGLLIALLAFFIFKFKNSNTVTVQAKKALAEIEVEFEDHRRRALEREQKVMRKLQDEINKQRKAGTK